MQGSHLHRCRTSPRTPAPSEYPSHVAVTVEPRHWAVHSGYSPHTQFYRLCDPGPHERLSGDRVEPNQSKLPQLETTTMTIARGRAPADQQYRIGLTPTLAIPRYSPTRLASLSQLDLYGVGIITGRGGLRDAGHLPTGSQLVGETEQPGRPRRRSQSEPLYQGRRYTNEGGGLSGPYGTPGAS